MNLARIMLFTALAYVFVGAAGIAWLNIVEILHGYGDRGTWVAVGICCVAGTLALEGMLHL